jgi:hypothetical protein
MAQAEAEWEAAWQEYVEDLEANGKQMKRELAETLSGF